MVLSKPNRVLISALSCFGSVIAMDAEERRNKWRQGHPLKCEFKCKERYLKDLNKNFTDEEAFKIEEAFVTWHNAFVTHKNPEILTIKPIGDPTVGEKMNGFFGPRCKYQRCTNKDCRYYSAHDKFNGKSYHFAVLNKSHSSDLINADVYCECEAVLKPLTSEKEERRRKKELAEAVLEHKKRMDKKWAAKREERRRKKELAEAVLEHKEHMDKKWAAKRLREQDAWRKKLAEEERKEKEAAAKLQQVSQNREEVITKTVPTMSASEVKQPTETIKKFAKALNITDVGDDALSHGWENILKYDFLVKSLISAGCMQGQFGEEGENAPRLKEDVSFEKCVNAFNGKLKKICMEAFKSHRRRLPVMERLLQEIRELNQK